MSILPPPTPSFLPPPPTRSTRRLRILHVTETYVRSGVGRAIDQIAKVLPEYEHHLAYLSDPELPADIPPLYASAHPLSGGMGSRISDTRDVIRALAPDVVHAHSSWAGVYVRARRVEPPVIYEPHCYKFDDPYSSWAMRAGVRAAERLMLPRTTRTAVLSQHEAELTRSLSPDARVHYIPNVPVVADTGRRASVQPQPGEDVVMIGRLCRQKDPGFFADVADELRRIRPQTRLRWIGDGEDGYRQRLLAAQVTITGWVQGAELVAELARPAVYLHTAGYEGFPLSVLDAAVSGLPVVARDIPPFAGTSVELVRDARQAAVAVAEVLDGGPLRARVVDGTNRLAELMTPGAQHDALIDLYESVVPVLRRPVQISGPASSAITDRPAVQYPAA